MKICYISKYANILKYGEDTRQFYFCKQFAKMGHESTLIMSNSSHLYTNLPVFKEKFKIENIDNVRVVIINLPKYKKATSLKRFFTWVLFEIRIISNLSKIFDYKQDVVIASSLSLLSIFSGNKIKRKHKAKLIFEVRDIWPLTLSSLKNMSSHNPIIIVLRFVEKFAYKKSNFVVGTMPGLNEHIKKSLRKNIQTFHIPQGVDLDFYTKKQELLEQSFIDKYLPKDKFTICYAGTFGVSYAIDKIIMAAHILKQKGKNNIQFVFLGDGIMKSKMQQMIEKLKLDNVTLVPRIPKTKVHCFLANSSVLLHSFKMKPVFKYGISPNKFIDYMYAARPVIVMFSGMPSIINEAKCGEFIPSEDCELLVKKVIEYKNKNKKDLDKIGANGKHYLINNLTYSQLAVKYVNICKQN